MCKTPVNESNIYKLLAWEYISNSEHNAKSHFINVNSIAPISDAIEWKKLHETVWLIFFFLKYFKNIKTIIDYIFQND